MPDTGSGFSLGDAVLTAVVDLTQMDAAFRDMPRKVKDGMAPVEAAANSASDAVSKLADSVEQTGKSATDVSPQAKQLAKSWLDVADATAENIRAQNTLRGAMAASRATAGQSEEVQQSLAKAQLAAAVSADKLAAAKLRANDAMKGSVTAGKEVETQLGKVDSKAIGTEALMGDLFGVRLPRHLRSFVAELPGVGTALSVAFEATAVLVLLDVLVNGVQKLIEWQHESERLREEWIKVDGVFADTSESIQRELDKSKEKFIEITQGPIPAMEFAFKHMADESVDALKRVEGELDTLDAQLKKQSGTKDFFLGTFGLADDDVKKFAADLEATMRKAREANAGDPLAGFRAGIDLTAEKIKGLKVAIGNDSDAYTEGFRRELAKVILLNQQLQQLSDKAAQDRDDKRKEDDQRERDADRELAKSRLSVEQQAAIDQLKLADEASQQLRQKGAISGEQEIRDLSDHEDQRYVIIQAALAREKQLANTIADPTQRRVALDNIQKAEEQAETAHQQAMARIRSQSYRQDAEEQIANDRVKIAATREGSFQRVVAEQDALEAIGKLYGEDSQEFIAQKAKVAAAQRAFTDQQKALAEEEVRFEEATAKERLRFNTEYYQFLYNTGQISASQLLALKRDEVQQEYDIQRRAIQQQISQLNPQQVEALAQLNHKLTELEQQKVDKLAEIDREGVATQQAIQAGRDLGIKTTEELNQEIAKTKQAYNDLATSGVASQTDLMQAALKLLDVEMEKLRVEIAEQKLAGEDTGAAERALARSEAIREKMIGTLTKFGIVVKGVNAIDKQWADFWNHDKSAQKIQNLGQIAKFGFTQIADGIAAAAVAAETGSESFGKAMEKMLASTLATISGMAIAEGVHQIALGFKDLATIGMEWHAPTHFIAAAKFFAVGAVTGIAAGLLSGDANGGQSAQGNESPNVPAAAGTQEGPLLQQPQNVPHFAGGGVSLLGGMVMGMVLGNNAGIGEANSPKLAVYDEGDLPEAHIPLLDRRSIPLTIDSTGSPAAELPDGRTIPAHFARMLGIPAFEAGGVFDMGGMTFPESAPLFTATTLALAAAQPAAHGTTIHHNELIHQGDIVYKGGDVQTNVEGIISDDTLDRVIGKINRRVKDGNARLHSSTTGRVVRKDGVS